MIDGIRPASAQADVEEHGPWHGAFPKPLWNLNTSRVLFRLVALNDILVGQVLAMSAWCGGMARPSCIARPRLTLALKQACHGSMGSTPGRSGSRPGLATFRHQIAVDHIVRRSLTSELGLSAPRCCRARQRHPRQHHRRRHRRRRHQHLPHPRLDARVVRSQRAWPFAHQLHRSCTRTALSTVAKNVRLE